MKVYVDELNHYYVDLDAYLDMNVTTADKLILSDSDDEDSDSDDEGIGSGHDGDYGVGSSHEGTDQGVGNYYDKQPGH